MIGFMPQIYPDELVYSMLARYYVYSGYSAYIDAADDLFSNKRTRPVPEFINAISVEAKQMILKQHTIEYLIENHTMFPAYGRFLSKERKNNSFQSLVNCDGKYMNMLYMPAGSHSVKYLRWCPECARADRKLHGETYWHRLHQIFGMDICPIHHCFLYESTVYMGKTSPAFISAEQEIPDEPETKYCMNKRKTELVNYMADVFMMPVDLDNDSNAGIFLGCQMDKKKYVHTDSAIRRLELFYEDYKDYYTECGIEIMSIDTMQKILNGGNGLFLYICELALFENVSVKALLSVDNMKKHMNQIYIRIAKQLNQPEELVAQIGSAVLKEYAASYRINRKSGVVRNKWDEIDETLLNTVSSTAKEIYGIGDNRPHRVTVKAMCKKLNLPDKRFEHLPKCKQEILKWSESQEHYWAREVLWAVKQIENSGENLCWRRIRDLTNMRKDNFGACMGELSKLTDKASYEQICQLIE